MKTDTTKAAGDVADERLFDNWFDPVETGLHSVCVYLRNSSRVWVAVSTGGICEEAWRALLVDPQTWPEDAQISFSVESPWRGLRSLVSFAPAMACGETWQKKIGSTPLISENVFPRRGRFRCGAAPTCGTLRLAPCGLFGKAERPLPFARPAA